MIDEKKLIEDIRTILDRKLAQLSLFTLSRRKVEQFIETKEDIISIIEQQPYVDKWIPFEDRDADEDEREAYGCDYMLSCKLPDEDEEILVTYASGSVGEDIFCRDGYKCYLDSGAEFITEAVAWMPKPQSYKKEGAE